MRDELEEGKSGILVGLMQKDVTFAVFSFLPRVKMIAAWRR